MDTNCFKDQDLLNSWLLICAKGDKPETKSQIDAAWCLEQGAYVNTKDDRGKTPLLIAASRRDSALVKLLLQFDANVNEPDENGDTPLYVAAAYMDADSVDLLLNFGAIVNVKNNDNDTPLHVAIFNKASAIELLLKKGADANVKDKRGRTPLHYAVSRKMTVVVEMLLKFGANPNINDNTGCTLLHEAISRKDTFLVDQFLKFGGDVNMINDAGVTPLHLAVLNKEARIVNWLLSLGANVNTKNTDGWTALRYAVVNEDNMYIVERLLNFSADVNVADKSGSTPLHVAAFYKRAPVVELLLKFGANVKIIDKYGYTPLHRGAKSGNMFIINLLLHHGAEVNAKNNKGNTPLHFVAYREASHVDLLVKFGGDINESNIAGDTFLHRAARHSKVSVVDLAIKLGADVNSKNGFGNTPLHEAVIYGNTAVVELLLKHGVDLNSTSVISNQPLSLEMLLERTPRLTSITKETNDDRGNTPLHLAAFYKKTHVLDLLLKFGADINAKNGSGNTPLHIAARCKHEDIVDMLLQHGADITLRNFDLDTPLTVARVFNYTDNEEVVSLLEMAEKLAPKKETLTNIFQTDNEIAVSNNDEPIKTTQEFKYLKKAGTSGVSGQLYETKLLCLVLIRALNDRQIGHFLLGTNVSEIGDLDDVCMRYQLHNREKPIVLFVQAKHREKGSIIDEDLRSASGDFSLRKYFGSYLMIKDRFRANNEDPMFEGDFNDIECNLIIYTPAGNCIEKKKTKRLVSDKVDFLINTGQTTDLFQYDYDEDYVDSLTELTVMKRLEKIGIVFIELIMSKSIKPDVILVNKQIARYHVVMGREVLQLCKNEQTSKEYRLWQFRSDFFDSDCKYLVALNKIFVKEFSSKRVDQTNITKEDLQHFKKLVQEPCALTISRLIGKSIIYHEHTKKLLLIDVSAFKKMITNDELNTLLNRLSDIIIDESVVYKAVQIKLTALEIKLPLPFGNMDMMFRGNEAKVQKRMKAVAEVLIRLLEINKDTKIIDINDDIVGPGKLIQQGIIDINGGIGSAVGNLFVLDESTNMLKFDSHNKSLPNYAAMFLKELQDDRHKPVNEQLYSYRIKINIDGFPKYSFNGDEYDKQQARDYLNKLWFYTDQARESTVELILKNHINTYYNSKEEENILMFGMHSTAIFLKSHDEVQKWWLQKGETSYLTEASDFFARAKQMCLKNLLLTVINYMCYMDIFSMNLKFNQGIHRNNTFIGLPGISDETLGKMFDIFDTESKSVKINAENKHEIVNLLQMVKKLATKMTLPESDLSQPACDILCSKTSSQVVTTQVGLQNNTQPKFEFLKRGGTSGICGQLYVTKLLCLVLIRALNNKEIEQFLLGTNIRDIGDIDDICLRYQTKGRTRHNMLFVRTKHKENREKGKLTKEDLQSVSGDFSVQKYFESYLIIKDRFQVDNKDSMFEGKFNDVECNFVIYTPTKSSFDSIRTEHNHMSKQVITLINTGQITDIYQCEYIENYIECLTELTVMEQLKKFAKAFIHLLVMSKNVKPDIILQNKLITRYHVIMGREVLQLIKDEQTNKQYYLWQFRPEFFESECRYLIALKKIFIKELSSKHVDQCKITDEDLKNLKQFSQNPCALTISKLLGKLITYNDKTKKLQFVDILDIKNKINKNGEFDTSLKHLSDMEIHENIINEAVRLKLTALEIKLPIAFGNLNMTFRGSDIEIQKRIKTIADKIMYLFKINKNTKVIEISNDIVGPDKAIQQEIIGMNGGIGSAVGNLLVLDKNTEMFKFDLDSETLPYYAALLLKEMKDERHSPFNKELRSYRIKINIDGFPKYSFNGDEYDKKEAKDFLSKLWFYTNQAKENEVEQILKDEIAKYHDESINQKDELSCRNISDPVFLTSHDAMLKWWMQVGESPYLSRASEIFEHAKQADISNLLLTVINYMYVSKIYIIDINIKQRTTEYLKFVQMHETFNKISCRLFYIFDTEFNKLIEIDMPKSFQERDSDVFFTELVFSLEIQPEMEWVALKISAKCRGEIEYFLVAKAGPGRGQRRAQDGFLLLQQYGDDDQKYFIDGAVDPGQKRHFYKSICRW